MSAVSLHTLNPHRLNLKQDLKQDRDRGFQERNASIGSEKKPRMTAPSFNGVFGHRWQAEILPARPLILPNRHFTYPAQVEEVERGALEILVRPEDDALPFLATCALGFRDPAAPTGLWATPDPDTLCALSGGYAYLISTLQPERSTMLPLRPVLEVLPVLEQQLLLFFGHHTILAWGANGQAWHSDRLSWEGITLTRIDGALLHGLGWDMLTDKEIPFTLDLRSGERSL